MIKGRPVWGILFPRIVGFILRPRISSRVLWSLFSIIIILSLMVPTSSRYKAPRWGPPVPHHTPICTWRSGNTWSMDQRKLPPSWKALWCSIAILTTLSLYGMNQLSHWNHFWLNLIRMTLTSTSPWPGIGQVLLSLTWPSIKMDGLLSSSLYRKPTVGNSILHASSFHPRARISSIPYR